MNGIAQSKTDTTSIVWKVGYLDIHHINTGRGVCSFFVLPDGTTMMVDAGDIDDSLSSKSQPLAVTPPYPNNSKTAGQWIIDYIKQVLPQNDRPVIDYALLTHFHGDHFGVVTNKTKASLNGAYKLSGYTEVGDILPIKMWIDRNYPTNNYPGYFTQSLPAFQRKVYHPKGVVEADINLVNFFGS
jgi:glyoxylase-like metal-dependent hydrolase (beta-lactamase superfamily II)